MTNSKKQSIFSYGKIRENINMLAFDNLGESDGEYSGLLMNAFYEIILINRPKLKTLPNNFKMHVAIADAQNNEIDPNLEQGYNIAEQILRENKVFHYKVVRPGVIIGQDADQAYQARKQITIYSGEEDGNRSLAEWEQVMDKIMLAFVDQNIKPKPEFFGEQDVRVKGSRYITYRCDQRYNVKSEPAKPANHVALLRVSDEDEKEMVRGFGHPYKDKNEPIDPLQGMRLSDIFYKKLLDAVSTVDLNNLSQKTQFDAIVSVHNAIEQSIRQDGIREANIKRVYKHIENNIHISLSKRTIMLRALLLQSPITETTIKSDISSQISDYEVFTSYSEAAAEYNQFILEVREKIKKDGQLPEWLGSLDRGLFLRAQEWQDINEQWKKANKSSFLVKSYPDKVALFSCDSTISAYEKKGVTITDLLKCNTYEQIYKIIYDQSIKKQYVSFIRAQVSDVLQVSSIESSPAQSTKEKEWNLLPSRFGGISQVPSIEILQSAKSSLVQSANSSLVQSANSSLVQSTKEKEEEASSSLRLRDDY